VKKAALGTFPTGIGGGITIFVAVLITERLASPVFVTYARGSLGFNVATAGAVPTGIVAITLFVVKLSTDTVLSPVFPT
jgi:preprotein translocase subunit SecY